MINELMTSKEQTAKFVHDAMEMETAVFTLGRAIRGCNKKKKQILENAQAKVDEAKAQVDRAENNYQQAQNKKTQLEQERISPLSLEWLDGGWIEEFGFFGLMWILAPIVSIVGCIITTILTLNGADDCQEIALITFIVSLVLIAIWLLISFICGNNNKFDHAKKISEQGVCVQKWYEDLSSKQSTHALALSEYSQAQLAVEALDAQIATLKKRREQIRNTLADFYALDVIKPKYRNIECAVIMDELYQNDRVDTMREAMDKCETRLFQNEVLLMGQNIQAMLGKMTIALVEISDKLDSINSNVKIMSQDLYTFSERMAQGQKNQQASTDELIRETQLSRYATQQVAASAAYLEWHQRNQNY